MESKLILPPGLGADRAVSQQAVYMTQIRRLTQAAQHLALKLDAIKHARGQHRGSDGSGLALEHFLAVVDGALEVNPPSAAAVAAAFEGGKGGVD